MDADFKHLTGVILAGGRGERFWPLSRRLRPKQLLQLFGDNSLLRTTWDRLASRLPDETIWVLTGDDLATPIATDLPNLLKERLVLESVGKNTAPALAVAAALSVREDVDAIQLVVPSDHWIPDPTRFWETIGQAVQVASSGDEPLVTFGIPITRPDTGYGYIERGTPLGNGAGDESAWQVAKFHEKPNLKKAKEYQAGGQYFWNSGIFLWRARRFLDEVACWMPELHALVTPLVTSDDPMGLLPELFHAAQSESVDFGVLEKSKHVAVVSAGFDWNDVGTWESWAQLARKDEKGNACRGDVIALETEDSVLYADDGVIATLGVKDLVVVRAGGVTLVAPKDRAQEVKQILAALRKDESQRSDLF
jgi:mannose-1-phosphate guanylyltransferase